MFPETYALIAIFLGLTIWLLLTKGITKRLMSLLFILASMMFVNTGNTSFIVYEMQHVNDTDFTYSGNRVINANNNYLNHTLTRETLQFPSEIQNFLITIFGLLLIIALFLIIDEISLMLTGQSLLRKLERGSNNE